MTTIFLPGTQAIVGRESIETLIDTENDLCCQAYGNGNEPMKEACIAETSINYEQNQWNGSECIKLTAITTNYVTPISM